MFMISMVSVSNKLSSQAVRILTQALESMQVAMIPTMLLQISSIKS